MRMRRPNLGGVRNAMAVFVQLDTMYSTCSLIWATNTHGPVVIVPLAILLTDSQKCTRRTNMVDPEGNLKKKLFLMSKSSSLTGRQLL